MNAVVDPVKPAVISITSQVARGAVGNRSVTFALEAMGHSVWMVPTVLLPWHPGHGRSTRIVPEPEQFEAFLVDLLNSPWLPEVGAILSGYMAGPLQAMAIARFVAALKEKFPAIRYLCDPVIGDHGGLYVLDETAAAIRDLLMPLADIATPNIHELGWLVGQPQISTVDAAVSAARLLNVETVLVTSVPAFMRGSIANLLVEPKSALLAEHRMVEGPTNGCGDLVSGLFLGHLLDGKSSADALQLTSSAIFSAMSAAVRRGSNELMPQADVASLLRPLAMVQVRSIAAPMTRLR